VEETRRPDPDDVLATLAADSSSTVRTRPWLKLGAIVACIVAMAAVVLYLLLPGQASVSYKTEPVVRHDLAVTITATGQLAPVNQVEVGSELSGTIAKVDVDYNDKVVAGQVLATLDTAELDATIVQQQAALNVAQARVEQAAATATEARLTYRRNRDLVVRKLASQEDLDASQASLARAEADLKGARAQVAQASATLDAARTRLSKSVIRAPISGIVLSRNVEPGQTVAASFNTPVLFSLAEDLARMELHVDVDEADVGHLEEGQPAQFTVDAYPARTFTAKVIQVRYAPRTVEGVVTYETLLSVDNEDLSLRPGMTATAEITVANVPDALLVPNAALRFAPETSNDTRGSANLLTRLMPRHRPRQPATGQPIRQSTVWILEKGNPVAVSVHTGMTDGRYTAITGNELAEGARVITGTITPEQ
jgi:HlyD family secretion protein